jgi:hypothetical protein
VPGGSGGGIPGNEGWTGLAFGRFFAGPGLAKRQLNRARSRVKHHAQGRGFDGGARGATGGREHPGVMTNPIYEFPMRGDTYGQQ